MTALVLALAIATLGTGLSHRLTASQALSPTSLFHLLFTALILVRPIIFMLGLDGPFPDRLFTDDAAGNFAQALVVSILWLLMFDVGWLAGRSYGHAIDHLFPSTDGLSTSSLTLAAISLTGMAALTTVVQIARFGSYAGLARATKVDKLSNDVLALRSFAIVATVLALALFLVRASDQETSNSSARQFVAIMLVTISASCSFAFGARDSAVIALVGIAIGPIAVRGNVAGGRLRMLLGPGVAGAGILALRVARDTLTFDRVSGPIDGQNFFRQLSVAANMTQFDSMALAVRDWPGDGSYRFGRDFIDGLLVVIPGGRPAEYERTALWWAREYVPSRQNGYPLTSIGEWFLNFGLAGVLVGGLVAGTIYASLDRRYSANGYSPLGFAVTLALVISFVQLGPWTSMPVVFRTVVAPLWMTLIVLRFLSSAGTRERRRRRSIVKGSA